MLNKQEDKTHWGRLPSSKNKYIYTGATFPHICWSIVSVKNKLHPKMKASGFCSEAFHSRWGCKKICLWKGTGGVEEWGRQSHSKRCRGNLFFFFFSPQGIEWFKVGVWNCLRFQTQSCHWHFKGLCLNYGKYYCLLLLLYGRDANIYMVYWNILKVNCLPSVYNCKCVSNSMVVYAYTYYTSQW